MAERLFDVNSNIVRFTLKNSTTGQGLTGLTNATSGLIISTICDVEATATVYTVAASNVETVATLGTYAAPTAGKCRFKEVDATNHKGLYEFQFADARFAVGNGRVLIISVTGAASLLDADYEIELVRYDPFDGVRGGLTALPNAAAEAAGGLYTRGTGAGQINQPANGQIDANAVKVGGTTQTGRDIGLSVLLSSGTGTGQLDFTTGVVKANLVQILASAVSGTAAQISAAFTKFFDKATPTGTINSLPDAVPGASGGLPTTNGTKISQTVDLTAGQTIGANLTQILGTALTETSGYLAAAFKKFFNIGVPVATVASVDQTGDSFARVGAAGAGLTALGDTRVANLDAAVSTRSTYAGGAVASVTGAVGSVTADVGITQAGADKVWGSAARTLTSFGTLVADIWAYTTRVLTAATNIAAGIADQVWDEAVADHSGAGSTGLALAGASAPTPAAVADAVWDEAIAGHLGAGSTGAALNAAGSSGDPWTTPLPGAYGAGTAGKIIGDNINAPIGTVDTVVDAIKTKTDNLPAAPAAVSDVPTAAQNAAAVGARAPGAEVYAAVGAIPTYDQFFFMIWAALAQFGISGTALSAKQLDGSTEAMGFTLDSATAPTSRVRAT